MSLIQKGEFLAWLKGINPEYQPSVADLVLVGSGV